MADTMEVGFHTVDGVRVRCAESTRLSAPSILLTSPWPESVYAFARVWPSLAAVARLVALDLPGFGRSERRDAGHFVWEERPDEYASLIADWVTDGYRVAAAHGP